ncbi:MAG: tetratricopeptide repeat protein, partial [Parachlamydia sp.]|nr:tetratricopeptide repeat protein [Parachlamydia sp.]
MNGDLSAVARGSQGAGSPPPIPAKPKVTPTIAEVRTSLGNSPKTLPPVPKKSLPALPPPGKAAPKLTASIIQETALPVLSTPPPNSTPAFFAISPSDQNPTVSKVAALRMGERASGESQLTPGINPSKERKPLPPPPSGSRNSNGVAAAQASSESLAERSKKERAHKQAVAAIKEKYGPPISEAEEQKNLRLLIERLRNLGQEMLKLHEWSLAAVYLNAALAVCKRHPNEGLRQSIVINMAEIEQEILEKEEPPTKKTAVDVPDRYFERRDQLNDLRKEIEKKSNARHPPKDILEGFSLKIDGFLMDILKDIYEEIGAPPCEFTLLGLGSYARKEMSPYSDLEFVILIKEKNPETLAYFRKLVKLLEIQVIHLGETKIDILEKGRKSPVKTGFSFDSGGNTPLAKQRELIMTPEELGYYQTDAGYDEDAILSIVLRTVGVAVGSHDLYNRYMEVKREILSRSSEIAPGKKIREQRALLFLRENLNEFAPKLDQHKKQEPRFDIKAELYRLLNFSIMGISEYYGIEAVNSWDKLKALLEQGILCYDGVENLKTALNATMAMRIRCQLHHKEENDKAYHPALKPKSLTAEVKVDEEFILSPEDIETITKIFSILKPLQAAIERVCETGDFSHLAKETFYQGNFALMGDNYVREKKFDAAKVCYERAIAVDPDNPEIQLKLAELLIEQAAFEEARPFASEAFSLGTKRQHKPTIARSSHVLGKLEITHCKRRSAVDYLMKALELYKQLKGSEHADVAVLHHDLGRAWMCEHFPCEAIKRNFDPTRDEWVNSLHGHVYKALDFYNQALDFYMRRGGQNQKAVATLISELAEASLYIPTWSDTLSLCLIEMAFKMGQVVFDETDPRWIEIVYRQGCIYAALGKPREEFEEKYRTAWVSQATWMGHETPFGKNNPYMALFLLAQGDAVFTHASDGSLITKSLKIRVRQWYGEALKIYQQIYPINHPFIAANMRLLALADKKNVAELEKALTMIKQIYGNEHPKVIFYLNTLAAIYQKLKKKEKVAACMTEAKRIASSPAYIQETKDDVYVPDNIEMQNQRVKANQRAVEVLTEVIRPNYPAIEKPNSDDASKIVNLAVLRASNHPVRGPIPLDPKIRMNLTVEIVDTYLKPIFRENKHLTRIDLSPFANSGTLDIDAVIALLKESTHIAEVIIDGSTFTGVALGQFRSRFEALASDKRSIQVTFIGKEIAILTELEILEQYRQEAEAGDKVGQYNLGIYHEYGKAGLLKSEAKAAEFYMKSAEQGYASAQFAIGCYFRDKQGGFPQSDQKAAEWFLKAAEQGNANAQNRLGYMHEMGLGGLEKSVEKALEYY